jgi:hypothetical protein
VPTYFCVFQPEDGSCLTFVQQFNPKPNQKTGQLNHKNKLPTMNSPSKPYLNNQKKGTNFMPKPSCAGCLDKSPFS